MRRIILTSLLSSICCTATLAVQHDETANSTTQVILTAKNQAVLSSQIAGTIISLPINEGESFKLNDDLVIFDCTIHEADLKKAKAHLNAKQAAYVSNQRLAKAKAVGNVELAQSRADYLASEGEVVIKQHTVDYCRVKAPFDGKLIKQHIHEHESVRQGQALVDVLDNSNLSVELIVPSQWLAWLKSNTPFRLYIEETGQEYAAHVTKILPRIDSVSQSIRIIGKINQPHPELINGMSGRAIFPKHTSTTAP